MKFAMNRQMRSVTLDYQVQAGGGKKVQIKWEWFPHLAKQGCRTEVLIIMPRTRYCTIERLTMYFSESKVRSSMEIFRRGSRC